MGRTKFRLFSFTITFVLYSLASTAFAESSSVWIEPSLSITRTEISFEGSSADPGKSLASGLDLGLSLISATAMQKRLRLGLLARQTFSRTEQASMFDLSETRLGLSGDWSISFIGDPRFGLAYYFGDTWTIRSRERQYNGSSFTPSFSFSWKSVRPQIWASFGNYSEGPGFIFLNRKPGDESLTVRMVGIGLLWSYEAERPGWIAPSNPD